MGKLLNASELAGLLGMSRVWVYKAAERGMLPFYRVGDAIRFDPGEIRSYLEARKGLKRDACLVSYQEVNKKP
jgi:excisionase family DNA binding protein